ncbi:MAG: glycosyltransferase family 2 protein [Bacilli bacterium]|nr:glycosyltransferase family 2 protein [Bacilli bacterium]
MNSQELFEKSYNTGLITEQVYNYLSNNIVENKLKKINGNRKISIIIPTYKREKLLIECIDSILKQSYQNFEIIVVDDCSNDGSFERVSKKYELEKRIVFIKNDINSGAGYSRKNGWCIAEGDYIIFSDDDDYYVDFNYFTDIVKIFEDDNYSIICSNAYTYYEKENSCDFHGLNFKTGITATDYLEKFQFYYKKPLSTFTAAFRKKVLEKADFSNMEMMNDSSIYLRALTSSNKVYVNEKIIGMYRIHSKGMSFNVNCDFLIKNLDEKKIVYNLIKEKEIFSNYDQWLEKQVELTVKYYIGGTLPNKENLHKVYTWVIDNCNNGKKIVNKLKLYNKKAKLRKIVRKTIKVKHENK